MILGPDGTQQASGIVDAHGEEIGRHGEPLTAVQVFLAGMNAEPQWLDDPTGGPRLLAMGYACQQALLYVQGKGPAQIMWRAKPPKYATIFVPEPEVPALIEALRKLVEE